jgi:hypothetical protein
MYIIPDREDKIVAMLTEQNPNEVALLRLTRELIRKAEIEQPEKKLNIVEQRNHAIIIEPALEQTDDTSKEQLQPIEIESTHKTRQEPVLGIDIEEGKQYEGKIQQTNLVAQQEEITKKTSLNANWKESKLSIATEKAEAQYETKQEFEKKINIVGEPLEESM